MDILAALACPALLGVGLCVAAARSHSSKPASLEQLRDDHADLAKRIADFEASRDQAP